MKHENEWGNERKIKSHVKMSGTPLFIYDLFHDCEVLICFEIVIAALPCVFQIDFSLNHWFEP